MFRSWVQPVERAEQDWVVRERGVGGRDAVVKPAGRHSWRLLERTTHYPSDVLARALLGAGLAVLMLQL